MIGKTLGKYKIIDLLGRGGMAEVYRAYQANLDRHVALKLIKTAIADNPDKKDTTRFTKPRAICCGQSSITISRSSPSSARVTTM